MKLELLPYYCILLFL